MSAEAANQNERARTATDFRSLIGSRVKGLDHLAIAVEDLEAAITWYCGHLGFTVCERRRTEGQRTAMISAVLKCGGAVIVLIQGTSPASQVSRFIQMYGPGVQHIALLVENLDELVPALTAQGTEADTEIIRGRGINQIFLKRDARTGVRVELVERLGGEFSDDTVQRLFLAFEKNDLY